MPDIIKIMLEVKHLRAEYKASGKLAIKDVSFNLKKGEILAVLGPSGCGKTTLLNLIAGLLTKQEVHTEGQIKFAKPNSSVATVFQTATLLPWRTVEANIAFGLEMRGQPASVAKKGTKKWLHDVGLHGFENYLPSQLSVGMQQRVNFARAVACSPDILLMDEPFSALDHKIKNTIQDKFLQVLKSKKQSAIFVTHNIDEAMYMADRVVILSESPAEVGAIIEARDYHKIPENVMSYLDIMED